MRLQTLADQDRPEVRNVRRGTAIQFAGFQMPAFVLESDQDGDAGAFR